MPAGKPGLGGKPSPEIAGGELDIKEERRVGGVDVSVEKVWSDGELVRANGSFRKGDEILGFHYFNSVGGVSRLDRTYQRTFWLTNKEGFEIGQVGVDVDEWGIPAFQITAPDGEATEIIEDLTGYTKGKEISVKTFGDGFLLPQPGVKRNVPYLMADIDLETDPDSGEFRMPGHLEDVEDIIDQALQQET